MECKRNRLAIVGGGDLGRIIAHHASFEGMYKVVGFFDDYVEKGTIINGIEVLGSLLDIEDNYAKNGFDLIILAIGYNHLKFRKKLYNSLKMKFEFASVIHPYSFVDKTSVIGQGVCIFPGTTIGANVVIKDDVLINLDCTISHDSVIKSHTFLSPRVAIAGFSVIGECCNIGINTVVIDNITITNQVQTGGGTVVVKNITEKGVYLGNPSRFLR